MSIAPRISPVRVLSASADPGLSTSRELLLRQHGYMVRTALSKAHALELLQAHNFDLLILGNSLSPDTCMELGRRFRAHNPRGRVIEILPVAGAPPMNQPDETVASLAGPDALLRTIEAQLGRAQ